LWEARERERAKRERTGREQIGNRKRAKEWEKAKEITVRRLIRERRLAGPGT
jgi:hypothetical protein